MCPTSPTANIATLLSTAVVFAMIRGCTVRGDDRVIHVMSSVCSGCLLSMLLSLFSSCFVSAHCALVATNLIDNLLWSMNDIPQCHEGRLASSTGIKAT